MTRSKESLTSNACERVFSIIELVSVFLHQAETPVLLNCQRICRLWKTIIDESSELQEHLFLVAATDSGDGEAVTLNPFLESHFNPLFACRNVLDFPSSDKKAFQTDLCTYEDLTKLPWARDGTEMDAQARQAYARPEASWRKMLISQPPIAHLDWWHIWDSRHNGGHSYRIHTEVITIGMLWDWLEAALIRECDAQVVIFPSGCELHDDPTPAREEVNRNRRKPLTAVVDNPDMPRISVTTHQMWHDEVPSVFHTFNIQKREWEVRAELPHTLSREQLKEALWFHGYGVHWLWSDLLLDGNGDSSSCRWSKNDSFECAAMRSIRDEGFDDYDMFERCRIKAAIVQRLLDCGATSWDNVPSWARVGLRDGSAGMFENNRQWQTDLEPANTPTPRTAVELN
jgi:hypothetical protein